jgi:phosphoglycolate phosphatase
MYSIVIFDLDGTLTDSSKGIISCVNYALDRLDYPKDSRGDLTEFIGPPLADSFIKYFGFSREKALSAVDIYRELYKEKGQFENTPYNGISECIKRLHDSGLSVCLATSKPYVFAKEILKQNNLLSYFADVVGSDLDNSMTDKAELIASIIRRYPDDPLSSFIMVGDRNYDVVGAKATGIHSMGVRYGFAKSNELETAGADLIADTPEMVADLILG